jgi:hypothetical protein
MAFDLVLRFTGIAAFITNQNYREDDDVSVYVIMPGVEGAKDALDDEPLCPHNSYVEPGLRKQERTSLKGTIVTFDLSYCDDDPPTYECTALPKELIDVRTLLADLCVVDLDVLETSSPPRPDFVMTQVLLPEGDFDCMPDGYWCIDPLGNGKPIKGPIAHTVCIKWTGLERASMTLTKMDGTGEDGTSWSPPGGVVTLKFVNTCKETPDLEGSKSIRDRDFKWYYELLTKSAKKDITDGLSTKDLPIPRYCTESADKGALAQVLSERKALVLSHDCFPAQMASYVDSAAAQE